MNQKSNKERKKHDIEKRIVAVIIGMPSEWAMQMQKSKD